MVQLQEIIAALQNIESFLSAVLDPLQISSAGMRHSHLLTV